ncbi:MAG: hypothetical protein HZC28_03870 [Spirochaetes bacterium]|nr:hypothetical protein [Spirochaetota bacterium]
MSVAQALDAAPQVKNKLPYRRYRCLFNHEFMLFCDTGISRKIIEAYIEKFKDTDVDAVMCCPLAHRTNLFPSKVDPGWKTYDTITDQAWMKHFKNALKYIYDGGDPVAETLAVCRRLDKGFFISYRMNDLHSVEFKNFPTHNAFWREHPEYWLADTDIHADCSRDDVRLFNWMIPEVREHYFAVIEELATSYDVDGIELDFMRCWRLFRDNETEAGVPVLTAFVQRIRAMLDRLGKARGKYLQLCVRVLSTPERGRKFGIDVGAWDRQGLIDMVNVSNCLVNSTEVGIESYKEIAPQCRIYGEMNSITRQISVPGGSKYRYVQTAHYRATALNYLTRADGISFFNTDWVSFPQREALLPVFKGIATVPFLQRQSKAYGIYSVLEWCQVASTLPAKDTAHLTLITGEDTGKNTFERAVLRLETDEQCTGMNIEVRLNGTLLNECEHHDTELFPIPDQGYAALYPGREVLKFYSVPLTLIRFGKNEVILNNSSRGKGSLTFAEIQLALYAPKE